ncbi:MAG: hypothetical protein IT341_03060 [Chloroflexi bacterium]|nr:hypothetical protein [Chloroflexota bacterium]
MPDGPDLEAMIRLITEAHPDAVLARLDGAAFFSLDDKHWPNFATIVWTDEHDDGAPSNLSARDGVFRVNLAVDPGTFHSLVGSQADPDYAALDTFVPHPAYAKQRLISILNPSHATLRDQLMPMIKAGHDRLAARRNR